MAAKQSVEESRNSYDWPLVDPNDDGIRPAGKPDQCFYCQQTVGTPHGKKCVIVTKLVEMRVTLKMNGRTYRGIWEVREPYSWDARMSEFHKNESSWCANNFLNEEECGTVAWESDDTAIWKALSAISDEECLCDRLHFEFVRVIDATPTRKLRTIKEQS